MVVNRRKRWRSKHFPVSSRKGKPAKPEKQTIADMVTAWLSAHRPVFLFLLIFGVLMSLFYAFALFAPFYERHFSYYLGFNARLSGYILGFLGQDITVRGALISSPAFSIIVLRGCDAIEPTALFICAVLAFPSPFSKKITGIVAGTLLLLVLNLVRIVTLFLVGVYFPSVFGLMHIDVWQGLFIFLTILFWVFWLLWTGKKQVTRQNAQA